MVISKDFQKSLRYFNFNFTSFIVKNKEIFIILLFSLTHLFPLPNKIYLLLLGLFLASIYLVRKNLLESLWIAFLATFPFGKGRYISFSVIPGNYITGSAGMNYDTAILFSDVLLALLVYILITRYRKKKKEFPSTKVDQKVFFSLILLIAAGAISSFYSSFSDTAFLSFLTVCKFIVLFFVSKVVFLKKEMVGMSIQTLGVFIILNSTLILIQYINGGPIGLATENTVFTFGFYDDESRSFFRPGGIFSDPNIAATLIVISLPFLLGDILVKDDGGGKLTLASLFITVLALIFTASRAAWVVSFFVVYLFLKNQTIQRKVILFLNVKRTLFLIVITLMLAPQIFTRLFTLGSTFDENGGGIYRLNHLKAGWNFLLESPQGIGAGVFPYKMSTSFPEEIAGSASLPHNIFVQVASEFGVVGLISLIFFMWVIIRQKIETVKSRKATEYASLFGFGALLIMSLFFPWIFHPNMAYYFWIFTAYYNS